MSTKKTESTKQTTSAEDYTQEHLINFLRGATIEGLLNPAVAKSRLNAVENLFVELTDEERKDLRLVDVDVLCSRFHKLHDSSIRPEVLELYHKRTSAALVDYFSWLDDPGSFFSIGGDTIRKDKRYKASEKEVSFEQKALEEITLATSERAADIFSIPLREDKTVYVQNLPLDLTQKEALKIAKVIQALAQSQESEA
ncbi:hypothetical protein [Aliikangiella coralliicola]|uniref:Uncharacterized protein n=1 Tax=Aliikangiella coralliicola TaxID=2592383 RepID=A0A545TV18_9GAMM|nr:hypothetical protein [Aliikangiella coralliicola]TQV81056.1 hypothetical protein FLL46_25935 [Aliikangiella coralliicola]